VLGPVGRRALGAILSLLLTGYLVYALLRPEKF
jgi:K+-transporting ATPase KdpF subunit